MKLITYNVNGIRAAFNKDFIKWLEAAQPDVLSLQEIKATQEQINIQALEDLGYHHFWFSAQKKGYSGVGILCKEKPKNVIFGMGNEIYDSEGRVIQVDFEDFSAISVYVPSATNIERLDFKLQFCDDFLNHIKKLRAEKKQLIISGDFNICHQAIDIHDPVRLKNVSGFLPIEREWLSKFISECGLIDSFRQFNQEPHHYTWWSYRQNSREKNKGWRLDYNFATEELKEKLQGAYILKDAVHSDHCPAMLLFNP